MKKSFKGREKTAILVFGSGNGYYCLGFRCADKCRCG